jgi:hypothetical protein
VNHLDITFEVAAQALHLAGDDLRVSTASREQLTVTAAFLAKARARFPDSTTRGRRRTEQWNDSRQPGRRLAQSFGDGQR